MGIGMMSKVNAQRCRFRRAEVPGSERPLKRSSRVMALGMDSERVCRQAERCQLLEASISATRIFEMVEVAREAGCLKAYETPSFVSRSPDVQMCIFSRSERGVAMCLWRHLLIAVPSQSFSQI